jgi:DNA repair protein RecO (recombination protein O)
MRWEDEGILLSFSPFGEKSQVASVFTQSHGRHKGLYRPSRQHQATLNPGAILAANWHARLEDHLGMWQFESIYSPLAWILHDPGAMNALLSAIALIEQIFPEREPHPLLYAALKDLSQSYQTSEWLNKYVLFELALIEHSGFPLDLSQCTVSGVKEDLVYVSPRTGKAVSQTAGLPYRGRY